MGRGCRLLGEWAFEVGGGGERCGGYVSVCTWEGVEVKVDLFDGIIKGRGYEAGL